MKTKNYIRGIAFTMCALVLSLSVMSAHTISVNAATTTQTSMTKLIDMILSKTGIVANESILNEVKNDLFELLNSMGDEVIQYHIDNNLELTRDSLKSYLESIEADATGIRKACIRAVLEIDVFLDALYACYAPYAENIDAVVVTESELLKGLGLWEIISSGVYTIWTEFVDLIRALFDVYAEEKADYYYIQTLGPDNINPVWFDSKTVYDDITGLIRVCEYPMFLDMWGGSGYFDTDVDNVYSGNSFHFEVFVNGLYLVDNGTQSSYYYTLKGFNNDWNASQVCYVYSGYMSDFDIDSYDSLLNKLETSDIETMAFINSTLEHSCNSAYTGIITNDGRKMKVFKDVNTMKLYSVGNQPYYMNQSNDYSTTNDNSVKFDGTYYEDNATTYSYDIVQNEIDNSTEINEETVNNIVNNTTSTIINNYYGSVSDDDGESGGSGSDDENHEELIEEIAGISDLIGLITSGTVGEIVEIAETVGDGLDLVRDTMNDVTEPIEDMTGILSTTVENVKVTTNEMSTDLGDVSDMMFDLFSFIPTEIMQLLKLSVIASLGLGVWRAVRG